MPYTQQELTMQDNISKLLADWLPTANSAHSTKNNRSGKKALENSRKR